MGKVKPWHKEPDVAQPGSVKKSNGVFAFYKQVMKNQLHPPKGPSKSGGGDNRKRDERGRYA